MRMLAALLVLSGAFLIWVAVVERQEELVGFGALMVAGGLVLWSRCSKEERSAGPTPAELAQRIQQLEQRLSAAEHELGLVTPEVLRLREEREFLRALYAGVPEKRRPGEDEPSAADPSRALSR